MKLCRFGKNGYEKPGLIDGQGGLRDLSSVIADITPDNLSRSTLKKLDAISQRLPAEFKTIGAEIAAQTSAIAKSIASLRGLAPSPPTSLLPEPATGPKPAPPPKARP